MGVEVVTGRVATMGVELDLLLAQPLEVLSTAERLAVAREWEALMRRQAVMGHRLIAGLADAAAVELGHTSAAEALARSLRISTAEAGRRMGEARDLAPRMTLTGQGLAPVLPHTAAAQERGQISREHVRIIRRFFRRLPGFVDYNTREAAEAQLAELACGLRPEELTQAATTGHRPSPRQQLSPPRALPHR